MTKKDYEFIARVISWMPSVSPALRSQRAEVAHAFARALSGTPTTNPRFDAVRFLLACGVSAEDKERE